MDAVPRDPFPACVDICGGATRLSPDWLSATLWSEHIWGLVLFAGPVILVWSRHEGHLPLLLITT